MDSDDRQQPVITGSLTAFQKTSVNIASANAFDIPYVKPGEDGVVSYNANNRDDTKNTEETNGIVTLGGGPNNSEENLEQETIRFLNEINKA